MDILDFKEDCIIYSNKRNLLKVSYEDILVVECDKPFVCFHLKDRKFLLQRSLESVSKSLKEYFIQINRRTIVNMKHAECIVYQQNSYWIMMENGVQYKISERREKEVRGAFCFYN